MRHSLYVLSLLLTQVAAAQSYGTYEGSVVAKWNDDGRSMTLVESFAYVDPTGVKWNAPSGSTVDGASIPQFAWSIIGGPFEGKYRNASVIHDVACVEKSRPWEQVHRAFFTGMLASGVSPAKAKTMYGAVYHFGPRWAVREQIKQTITETIMETTCVDGPFFMPMCRSVPKQVSREIITDVAIPPAPYTLSREAFERLAEEIDRLEATSTPMTVERILNYK